MVKRTLIGLLSGVLFGAGLAISGMLDPVRVRGFLDVLGRWDPTLAFVMGGALLPMAGAWWLQRRLPAPFADQRFHLPDTHSITAPLVLGAAVFGIGWGLGGLCPGPALAVLALQPLDVWPFVVAMLAGFVVAPRLQGRGRTQ